MSLIPPLIGVVNTDKTNAKAREPFQAFDHKVYDTSRSGLSGYATTYRKSLMKHDSWITRRKLISTIISRPR